jgi:hypothetical protein
LRNDRARIDVLMKLDSLMLRDTTRSPADSLSLRSDTAKLRADTINRNR